MALWKCSHQCHWFAYQMNLISGWIILLLDKKYRITFCLLAGWRCAWHLLGVLSYCQTRIRSYSPEQHVCCRYECFQWKFDSDIKNIYIYIKWNIDVKTQNEMLWLNSWDLKIHFDFQYMNHASTQNVYVIVCLYTPHGSFW